MCLLPTALHQISTPKGSVGGCTGRWGITRELVGVGRADGLDLEKIFGSDFENGWRTRRMENTAKGDVSNGRTSTTEGVGATMSGIAMDLGCRLAHK